MVVPGSGFPAYKKDIGQTKNGASEAGGESWLRSDAEVCKGAKFAGAVACGGNRSSCLLHMLVSNIGVRQRLQSHIMDTQHRKPHLIYAN